MWKCSNCKELIDDQFDTCWNCGTRTDGTHEPSFARDPDAADAPKQAEELAPQLSRSSPAREGFAYSLFADFALLIGQVCALLGCVVAIIYGVLCLAAENWIGAVLLAPLLLFLSLANFVVFARVSRL